MKYRLFFEKPHLQLIRIRVELPRDQEGPLSLHLPYYRPGRYERAVYFENVVDVRAFSGAEEMAIIQTSTHSWEVPNIPSGMPAYVEYRYYGNTMDAGSSYFDDQLIYLNGVNLFMFIPGRENEPCEVEHNIPADFKLACTLTPRGETLLAADFHELADTPWLAAPELLEHRYEVAGIPFHLWFYGQPAIEANRILTDFIAFTRSQIELFGDFPVEHYHFLFLNPNRKAYHGVEHERSTVILLGPGHRLMSKDFYPELLGISCHELFHTWNVKALRPADMVPYNYVGPQYSRMHYITEGITTYYGDLMLYKSGVWDLPTFLETFNRSNLLRHYQNAGWQNVSLEDSSFNSWRNGYKPGVPNYKISFYTKGALVAFLLDHTLRKSTGNKGSLDLVMRKLWDEFGRSRKGFDKAQFRAIAEAVAGHDLGDFFSHYIEGATDLTPALREAAAYFGLEMVPSFFPDPVLSVWGFRCKATKAEVFSLFPGSPADRAGLSIGDELVAVNDLQILENGSEQIQMAVEGTEMKLHVFRQGVLRELKLQREAGDPIYFYQLRELEDPSPEQSENLRNWSGVNLPA